MRAIDKLLIVLVLVLLAIEIASRTSPVRDDPLKGRRPMPPVAEAPGVPNPSPPRVRRPPLAAPRDTLRCRDGAPDAIDHRHRLRGR
jgi:hypothetical protein